MLLLGIFVSGLVILAVILLEAARNWHDWLNRHPHFTLRPAGRWADTRPSAKLGNASPGGRRPLDDIHRRR